MKNVILGGLVGFLLAAVVDLSAQNAVMRTGQTIANPTLTLTPVAVGSLASCGAGTANQVAIVNDALLPALGGAVANGGLLTVGVICKSGTGWIVF